MELLRYHKLDMVYASVSAEIPDNYVNELTEKKQEQDEVQPQVEENPNSIGTENILSDKIVAVSETQPEQEKIPYEYAFKLKAV